MTSLPRERRCLLQRHLAHLVRGLHQLAQNVRLTGRVTGSDDLEICLGPGAVQIPRRPHRAHHVVAALHDHARNVADAVYVLQQELVAREEAAVDEVVVLDPRKGQRKLVFASTLHLLLRCRQQGRRAHLPRRPRLSRLQLRLLVVARQPLAVGSHHVAPLVHGDGFQVLFPLVREDIRRPLLVVPLQLVLAQHEDATQHQRAHPRRMALGIRQRQRASPRAPKHVPLLHAEVLAQPLHVRHQVPRGVRLEACMRRRLAASALVELDDAVGLGVEVAAVGGRGSATRATVHNHNRHAIRVAAFLEVELVDVVHTQPADAERLDLGVQLAPLLLGGLALQLRA
mmetsp:Transcript_16878/g.54049  ORF Transcript_16878/g.54049 Transcript_16878/m.54049 type:complete len:342 (-) Transcript_16878:181-1206(-)